MKFFLKLKIFYHTWILGHYCNVLTRNKKNYYFDYDNHRCFATEVEK